MQAFLITAYKDFDQLYELVTYLGENNKVFVHVDKSSREITAEQIGMLNRIGGCTAISTYEICWGSFTHVQAILALIELALKSGEITYMHLITAQDLPVISLDEIERRFDRETHIYMDYIVQKDFTPAVKIRYQYYNWFVNRDVKKKWLWSLQYLTVLLQKLLFIKRKGIGPFSSIYKGLVYISMPRDAAAYVIDYCREEPSYLKSLKRCQVPEEFFFQTLFMNSYFKERVIKRELRYMNWEKGDGSSPAFLDESDYEMLMKGDYVFARKFDREISQSLKERIMRDI
ncbi:MAG: hypothetical protein J6P60_00460 [Lachnospiraceae bacterium]|nr:hypothetical protein [Lachnospiraceae bacterium]